MTFIRDLEPCTYFDHARTLAPQPGVRWVYANERHSGSGL